MNHSRTENLYQELNNKLRTMAQIPLQEFPCSRYTYLSWERNIVYIHDKINRQSYVEQHLLTPDMQPVSDYEQGYLDAIEEISATAKSITEAAKEAMYEYYVGDPE